MQEGVEGNCVVLFSGSLVCTKCAAFVFSCYLYAFVDVLMWMF